VDLRFSPEHEDFRGEVRAFLDQHAHLTEHPWNGATGRPSVAARKWQQLLLQHGYTCRTIPREYGGYGAAPDILKAYILSEEFTRAEVPQGLRNQGISMLVPTLLEHGSKAQRERWIAPTIRGDIIWCQGYSEPEAGSDLASLRTHAKEDGEDFVINGQKIWTSSAHHADMMFMLVRTEPAQPKHKSISYLLLPMDTPGIEVRLLRTMTGRAEFNEVFFTDVRVPVRCIVGRRGEGWKISNTTLKHERGMLGDPDQALDMLGAIVKMMREETLDDVRLMDIPLFRDRLLRLQARALAMRFHGLRLLTAMDRQEDSGIGHLIVKLNGTELNHEIGAFAIDLLGELGILYDGDPYLRAKGFWQKTYMFALGLVIGGGTSQIQKNIISERGLGMPREPRPASS